MENIWNIVPVTWMLYEPTSSWSVDDIENDNEAGINIMKKGRSWLLVSLLSYWNVPQTPVFSIQWLNSKLNVGFPIV